jgi:hypothetical protein
MGSNSAFKGLITLESKYFNVLELKGRCGVEVQLQAIITSAPDGDEWSVSGRGQFTSWEIALDNHRWMSRSAAQPVWRITRYKLQETS